MPNDALYSLGNMCVSRQEVIITPCSKHVYFTQP